MEEVATPPTHEEHPKLLPPFTGGPLGGMDPPHGPFHDVDEERDHRAPQPPQGDEAIGARSLQTRHSHGQAAAVRGLHPVPPQASGSPTHHVDDGGGHAGHEDSALKISHGGGQVAMQGMRTLRPKLQPGVPRVRPTLAQGRGVCLEGGGEGAGLELVSSS